tara:strand:- start:5469 stop:5708 length:240 start_codon:yes stop_codon:yes gene_type:complete
VRIGSKISWFLDAEVTSAKVGYVYKTINAFICYKNLYLMINYESELSDSNQSIALKDNLINFKSNLFLFILKPLNLAHE